MKEFLLDNYSWISTLLFGLASVLVFIFKKVKIIKKDTAFEKVLKELPYLINKAEKAGGTGAEKKNNVLQLGLMMLRKYMDDELDYEQVSYYSGLISDAIEDILSTPKKKEKIDEK